MRGWKSRKNNKEPDSTTLLAIKNSNFSAQLGNISRPRQYIGAFGKTDTKPRTLKRTRIVGRLKPATTGNNHAEEPVKQKDSCSKNNEKWNENPLQQNKVGISNI